LFEILCFGAYILPPSSGKTTELGPIYRVGPQLWTPAPEQVEYIKSHDIKNHRKFNRNMVIIGNILALISMHYLTAIVKFGVLSE
jgi:hypothetical protein